MASKEFNVSKPGRWKMALGGLAVVAGVGLMGHSSSRESSEATPSPTTQSSVETISITDDLEGMFLITGGAAVAFLGLAQSRMAKAGSPASTQQSQPGWIAYRPQVETLTHDEDQLLEYPGSATYFSAVMRALPDAPKDIVDRN